VYAEETEEPAPVPVGLARHQTKWPCDQVGPPPGPPPTGLRSALDPGARRRAVANISGLSVACWLIS